MKASFPLLRAVVFPTALFFTLAIDAMPAHAVAQWSRLYAMSCEGCHTSYPRLNLTGWQFKRNGYRFTFNEKGVLTARNASSYVGPTWTPTWNQTGERTNINLNTIKIHIGGPVGRSTGFLIQPTPGNRADVNLAQGLVVFGNTAQSYRLVGGRLLSWLNGGSVGAGDRAIGATAPRVFAELHGVSPGGIGNGVRFETNWASGLSLAAFTSDMEATAKQAQTTGISLLIPISTHTVSVVELFAAYGAVPAPALAEAHASRYGLLVNRWLGTKKHPELFNVSAGYLYGEEDRAVKAGLPTHLWTGFAEIDWQSRRGLSVFARHDWEHDTTRLGSGTTFTIGSAVPITRNLRLDLDLTPVRPSGNTVEVATRLRMVY